MSEQTGFVAFQYRGNAITVTFSRPDLDLVRRDLREVGLSTDEVSAVTAKVAEAFRSMLGESVTPAGAVENATTAFNAPEVGPKCAHGVPMAKRKGKNGYFWSCQAKAPDGTFYWKLNEGCRAQDYEG